MSNITVNCLEITGAKSTIKKCINRLNNKDGNNFDLNKIIQMPTELFSNKKENNELQKIKKQLEKLITNKIKLEKLTQPIINALKEYDDTEWDIWCTKNWGTKGNTSETEGYWIPYNVYKFYFNTPYTPPIEAISQLAKDYPTLMFELEAINTFNGIALEATWYSGELINNCKYYTGSRKYGDLYFCLLHSFPPKV